MSVKHAVKVLGNLILLIVLCAGFSACGTTQPEQTATPLPIESPLPFPKIPTLNPATATPSASSETFPQEPPACTFPLAQTTTAESTPENYTFSQPKVVLTAPKGGYYDIIQWLPNNQQVLMTKVTISENGTIPKAPRPQSIELYIPETGKSTAYAIRPYTEEPPTWQAELNAVVYPVMNFLGWDQNIRSFKFSRQVWVSHGNSDTTHMLADNLSQFPIAIKPDGSQMLYLSDKQIFKLDGSLKELPSIPFDPTQWDYAKSRRNSLPVSYEMAWQPGTPLIFLHSVDGMELGGGYTFILNANTGQVCELNFGGWAVRAHWSSDGRYLAIIKAVISSSPVNVTDLVVLNTATGYLTTLNAMSQNVEGGYVDDFVWAPDNRHILALGHVPSQTNSQGETIHHELYLVDRISDQSIHLFPEFKSFFADGAPMNNFAWSSDGSKLLIRCPTNIADRICFISIKQTIQP